MQRKSLDVWVGLFVVLGVAALMFLALKAGNMSSLSFGKAYTVTAKFDNVGSLRPQAPVKAAGVVVGRVESIKFDDKTYQALVTLNMEVLYKFPKDSSVKILAAGDKIARTQSAAVLEDLINQFIYSKAADGKDDKK